MAALKWADVDFVRSKLTVADKVDATRKTPLTDYLAPIPGKLPRVGKYVFASGSQSGRLTDTRASHGKALKSAGAAGLTTRACAVRFRRLARLRARTLVPSPRSWARSQVQPPKATARAPWTRCART